MYSLKLMILVILTPSKNICYSLRKDIFILKSKYIFQKTIITQNLEKS